MYGAMLGDIIGSRFEFDRGRKTKEFAFFTRESQYTDDSVMTVAVAEALMNVGPDAKEDKAKAKLIRLSSCGKLSADCTGSDHRIPRR